MRRTATAMVAGVMVLLAGCSASDTPASRGEPAAEAPPAELSLAVADGSTDVSPVEPLEISVTDGELTDVTLVDADGAAVDGGLTESTENSGTQVWVPETPLAYGTGYTLTATATATDADDAEATASATFTTVDPETLSTPSIGPLDGMVVGVGLPIRVYFDDPVEDKAAVESHLLVTTSNPTDGVWSWLNDAEVHFRPSEYWPPHTEVTLDAMLYGVDFGGGVWGEKDRTVSFTIGEKHVSIADAANYTMQVFDGDQLVQTFPISAGGPEFPSRNGPHVVTELNRNRVMDSSTYGVPVDSPNGYRTPVEFAVRLSNNGEFVHAAPWSVAQQGNTNVSHGCINMSTENAAWFFRFSQPGDVVEIVNSIGPALSAADGDIYDWAIPWEKWQAGSALK